MFALCVLFVVLHSQLSNGAVVVSLKNYNATDQNAQSFTTTAGLNDTNTLTVTVTDLHYSIKYFIVQSHSFQTKIVVSNNLHYPSNNSVNGTNVGLVQRINSGKTYNFYIKNQMKCNNTILIVVVAYRARAPIPGGCNMEFMVETAPYQILRYTNNLIEIQSQSASIDGLPCESQLVRHEMYHMYLPERDYTAQTYFTELEKMILADDIILHGSKVFKPVGSNLFRTLFSAYRGTGSIHAIIATYGGHRAAYIPVATYACDALDWTESCDAPRSVLSKILCGIILFVGLFTCYFGHKFFKTEMFLVGMLIGGYFSYVALSAVDSLDGTDVTAVSLVIAVACGFLWMTVWCLYGIPVLSIVLVLAALGFLAASTSFFTGLGDLLIFESDLNYWSMFASIVMVCVVFLIGLTHHANILACSVIGAYVTIVPIDHYIGANLRYIFINTMRRITDRDFQFAVLDPPFQFRDAVLVAAWAGLAASGLVHQLVQQRGRPPFPPARARGAPLGQLSERTPLLGARPAPSAPAFERA